MTNTYQQLVDQNFVVSKDIAIAANEHIIKRLSVEVDIFTKTVVFKLLVTDKKTSPKITTYKTLAKACKEYDNC